jgi:hypothetical protein
MAVITDRLIDIEVAKSHEDFEYLHGGEVPYVYTVGEPGLIPIKIVPCSGMSVYKNLELTVIIDYIEGYNKDFSNIEFLMNDVQIPHIIKSFKFGEKAECLLKFPASD